MSESKQKQLEALAAMQALLKEVTSQVHSEAVENSVLEPTPKNINERNKLKKLLDKQNHD